MHRNKPKTLQRRFMTMLELLIGMALTMALLSALTFFYQQITQMNAISEKTQKEIFHLQYAENRLSQVLTKALGESTSELKFYTAGSLSGILSDNNPSLVFQFETGTNLDNSLAVSAIARLFVDKQNRLCLATWPDPAEWSNIGETLKPRIEILLENVESIKFLFYVAPERDRSLVTGKNANTGIAPDNVPEQNKPSDANPKAQQGNKKTQNPSPDTATNAKKNSPDQSPSNPQEKQPESDSSKTENLANTETQITEPEPKGAWISEWKRQYKQLPSMIKIEIIQKNKEKPITLAFPFLKSKNVIVYEQ